MKKIFICLITLVLFTILSLSIKVKAVNLETGFTLLTKESRDLGYGITLDIVTGESKSASSEANSADGRKQYIATAMMDKDSPAKVVEWSYICKTENRWSGFTIEAIAKNYEETHPNEEVIVGTNNWLCWTQSNNTGELSTVTICGGLKFRVSDINGTPDHVVFQSYRSGHANNFLGFDKDGKTVRYIEDFNEGNYYTKHPMLSIYNGYNDFEPLNMEVAKVNEAPLENEISVIFHNYPGKETKFEGCKILKFQAELLRIDNIPSVEPIERDIFALGTLIEEVDEVDPNYDTAGYYTYYFVSRNEDFNNYDFSNKTIVCQHELLGELSSIAGATSYFQRIVRKGVPCGPEEGGSTAPRTVFITKEDGSVGLSVVDGRQADIDRIGMDYTEMAYYYKNYYDGYDVFNYDGGGSTCMVVKNKYGGFDVVNSPSDGNVRLVANATLFVVDKNEINVELEESKDNSLKLKVNTADYVKNVTGTLGDKTINLNNGYLEFDGLTHSTDYNIKINYQIDGSDKVLEGPIYQTSTSVPAASLSSFTVGEIEEEYAEVTIKIDDPYNSFFQGILEYNNTKVTFTTLDKLVELLFLEPNTTYNIKLSITSNVGVGGQVTDIYNLDFKTLDIVRPPAPIEQEIVEPKKGCKKGIELIIPFMTVMSIFIIYRKKKY